MSGARCGHCGAAIRTGAFCGAKCEIAEGLRQHAAEEAEAQEEARLVFEHETAREHVANALQMLTMAERTCSPGVNIAAVTIADHDAIVARLRKAIAKIDAQAKARAEIRAAVESIREKVKAAQSSDDLSFVISLREMVAIFESLDDISKAAR